MIKVPPRVPATARESIARGVFLRPARRIASPMPGASRSITAGCFRSHIQDRGSAAASRIRSNFHSSAHSRSFLSGSFFIGQDGLLDDLAKICSTIAQSDRCICPPARPGPFVAGDQNSNGDELDGLHPIAGLDGTPFQDASEDPFPGHDAVADLPVDGTMMMTFLAMLGDLQDGGRTNAQAAADRQGQ